MKRALVRNSLCCALMALSVALAAEPAMAQQHNLQIRNMSLSRALREYGRSYGRQLIFTEALVRGKRAPNLVGSYTAEDALERLLAGSGLAAQRTPAGAIMIVQAAATRASSESGEAGGGGARVSGAPGSEAGRGSSLEHDDEVANANPEIVVTGTNIRGRAPVGSPLITISRADLESSGYGRVQDFLQQLPQNFAGISEDFSQSSVANQNLGSDIQLRGLGPGTTLTLINGRRPPGGGSLGAFTDISTIPQVAIERIEIIPDGASAIYGSDAIGGVVNFVLRQDFDGAESRVRVATSDGNATEVQVSNVFGREWPTGNFLVGFQYSHRDPLYYGSDPYSATNGDYRIFGGTDRRRDNSFARGGAPGNILNSAGQVAYAIPSGQDGTNLTVASLLPGQINYQDRSYAYLLPKTDEYSIFAFGRQQVTDGVELSGTFRYNLRDVLLVRTAGGRAVSVPSANPFYVNPFGGSAPVRVEYDFTPELGPQINKGSTETIGADLGARIRLPSGWQLALAGNYGVERTTWHRSNNINNSAVTAALALTNRATALNVFGNGTANNPATLASLRSPDSFDQSTNTAWAINGIFDGPLFQLPGGTARAALGGEYRASNLDITSNFSFPAGQGDDSRRVYAGFAEISLPLIGPGMSIPGVRHLSTSVAFRYDRYREFGSTFNPHVGLEWEIVDGVSLRGSWGTSFRAPPFYQANDELNATRSLVRAVTDPTSSTGTTNSIIITGVSPTLISEKADVWTAGVDLHPLSRLHLSFSYFNIAYDGKIDTPIVFTNALISESQLAGTGVVTRNPSQAQIDAICSLPTHSGSCVGVKAIIDVRRQNIAAVNVSGLDFSANYSRSTDIGEFGFRLNGTYLFDYRTKIAPSSPVIDVINTYQRPLRFRAQGGITWSSGSFGANLIVNYAGVYRNTSVVPAQEIRPWTTVNLGASYAFGGGLSGTRLLLNVTNLFDRVAPFVNVEDGYDLANGSVMGRTIAIQVVRNW